jgi:hypothetical protein
LMAYVFNYFTREWRKINSEFRFPLEIYFLLFQLFIKFYSFTLPHSSYDEYFNS